MKLKHLTFSELFRQAAFSFILLLISLILYWTLSELLASHVNPQLKFWIDRLAQGMLIIGIHYFLILIMCNNGYFLNPRCNWAIWILSTALMFVLWGLIGYHIFTLFSENAEAVQSSSTWLLIYTFGLLIVLELEALFIATSLEVKGL